MTGVIHRAGVSLSGAKLQAVPLPNGPVHTLNTVAGAATTADLQAGTVGIALTLTDPHWLRLDGGTAAAGSNGEFKIPAGFSFWPVAGASAVSLFPEGGAAASGDSIQVVGEYL